MSQYDKLDSLIYDAISSGSNRFIIIYNWKRILHEALRISSATGRDTGRIVDGRLQALRKRGLIVHVKGWGWRVKEAA